MLRFCKLCEGKMNRFRYPLDKRFDHLGRQLIIYKCIECGEEITVVDV